MNDVDRELALLEELEFEQLLHTLADNDPIAGSGRVRSHLILACFNVR